ncbi:MAG: hypothetical protein N3E46_15830 [Gemmataceae bacterium]|uniref:Uncharacterized protein n=1 Tax=Thermogemmata fonticola TaxID=2755323 RepID=A0A7V8VG30_9BACT|nr:hypothetical protein [Thermogemmata fonticola]MBA2227311.1 hypothetical protein [Thermogemmata fonticola]MCX8141140.1 hypothetical protein [Gemmataceae bacterium]
MEDEDLYRRYQEFLKEQEYKRLSDRVAREVAAMGAERFAEAIKRYLKDSPELARRLMEMVPELRKAAFEVASEKEIADAVVKKGADKVAQVAPELRKAAFEVAAPEEVARAAAEKDAVVTAVTGLAALKMAPEKIAQLLAEQGHKVTVEQIRQILGQAQ